MSSAIPARRTTLGPALAPAKPRISDTLVTSPSATPNTAARAPPPWTLRWWWSHRCASPVPRRLGWASDARRPNSRAARPRVFELARSPSPPRDYRPARGQAATGTCKNGPMAEPRRWFDPSQPQTLQGAVMLSYVTAAISLLLVLFGAYPLVISLGLGAAAYGVANEQRWGYWLGDRAGRAQRSALTSSSSFVLGCPQRHPQPRLHGRPRGPVPPSPEPRVPARLVQVTSRA